MTPSADLSPPRRPIFFPVVIATVFLTILGMAGGFVLGERHRQADRAQDQASRPPTQATEPAGPVSATSAPSGPACPSETSDTAQTLGFSGDLRQVFKIVTDNGTVVWLCQDPDGRLYYQGKTGGVNAPLEQNKNGLFLSGATHPAAGQYRAVDQKGTIFTVNKARLQLLYQNGSVETHAVTSVG